MSLLPFEKVHREILVKCEAETDPAQGCYPDKRSIPDLIQQGILVLNKPKGPSSHQCSDFVQNILGLDKAGHGGTLDPAVTGVLPTALGNATRIVQALLPAGKEYVGIMHLHKDVSEDQVRAGCQQFVGRILQMVPRKAAVKRQERERSIYYFDILEIIDKDVLFVAGVEAGTYIRKLCHDMGQIIGGGGHMAELIRTKARQFNHNNWVTLQELEDAVWYYKQEGKEELLRKYILPVEVGCQHLAKIWVLDSTVASLCNGAPLHLPGIAKIDSGIEPGMVVAIMSLKGELVALAIAALTSEQIMSEKKGVAARPHKVFMKAGIYKTEPRTDNRWEQFLRNLSNTGTRFSIILC